MPRNYEGPKYDAKLSRKEIAIKLREEVKAAIVSGDLPKGLKVSVKMRDHKSLDMTVVAVPAGFKINNPARVRLDVLEPNAYHERIADRYAEQAVVLKNRLEGMLQAYNYDNSDSMTDYFDVNFYGHADYSSALLEADREAQIAASPELAAVETARRLGHLEGARELANQIRADECSAAWKAAEAAPAIVITLPAPSSQEMFLESLGIAA